MRWLQPRKLSSPARWAAGCHDCGVETSFSGEASNVQAWVWYNEHFRQEEPRNDLAYLTLAKSGHDGGPVAELGHREHERQCDVGALAPRRARPGRWST